MSEKTEKNEFEKLCFLATVHDWCWKVPCTTCGNMDIRIGIILIADGIPLESRLNTSHGRHRQSFVERGEFSRIRSREAAQQMPTSASERLVSVLCSANLSAIRKYYRREYVRGRSEHFAWRNAGPETWLGYLGVVLSAWVPFGEGRERVARAWRIRLNQMLDEPSRSGLDDSTPVTFQDLRVYWSLLPRMPSRNHLATP